MGIEWVPSRGISVEGDHLALVMAVSPQCIEKILLLGLSKNNKYSLFFDKSESLIEALSSKLGSHG